MSRRTLHISALAASLALAGPAMAADKAHPDWPCIQKKVETLAASQVWDGPSIEGLPDWRDDEKIAELVKRLASRRQSIDAARVEAEAFAKEQPEAERDKRLTLLFAGLFDTLTSERRTIMAGIEKYNRRQKERAGFLEDKGKAIAELEAKAGSDEKAAEELAKAQEDYDWDARVFKERNDNLPVACELPVLIDQRLFELSKGIRGMMKG